MARQSSHRAKHQPEPEPAVEGNGPPDASAEANGSAAPTADDRMRRAEEMVDQMAQRVGDYAGRLGHGLLRLAARAREEAEDIWAEARSIARGEKP
jgi:hypothetical protein